MDSRKARASRELAVSRNQTDVFPVGSLRQQKIDELEKKIAELSKMRDRLMRPFQACRGTAPDDVCAAIQARSLG